MEKGRSKAALQKVKDNYFTCCAQKGHLVKLLYSFYQNNEPSSKKSFC
jgi:DNA polymerase-3 subunit alpha/error-prone DNA polymerase